MPDTAYDEDALRAAYGTFPVGSHTFDASHAKYEARADAKRRDALGGARVLVREPGPATAEDARLLFGYEREEDRWDVPGGGREPGETPEATAHRELAEEVGIAVDLTGVVRAMRFRFTHADRTVGGLWVYFVGVARSASLDVDGTELADARWFDAPPADCDPHAVRAVETFRDG
ncbi:MAG: NUDIX hydrolase [Halobaculum sp.]